MACFHCLPPRQQNKSVNASLSRYILFRSTVTQYENSCGIEVADQKIEKQSTVKYLAVKTYCTKMVLEGKCDSAVRCDTAKDRAAPFVLKPPKD